MRNLILVILAAVLTGRGSETTDNRADLSQAQRADIAKNIASFSTAKVEGEVMQVAVVEDLAGKAKYGACAACHGNKGQGGIGPMLAGQSAEYISGRLLAYKAGETVGAQSSLMWGQASMLSETDIQNLAEYTASL